MKRLPWPVAPCLLLGVAAATLLLPCPTMAQEDPLTLLQTIDVGGSPDAIVVDISEDRHDILYYDQDAVHFIDGDTLLPVPGTDLPIPTDAWEGWMVYDRHHHQTYVVTVRDGWTAHGIRYDEVWVHVIADRLVKGIPFSVNEVFNEAYPDQPPDKFFGLDGLALKQPLSEGDNPARLIVDDTANGNITVVDLDGTGTGALTHHRYSYRDSLCGESNCSYYTNQANTLALETNHETLPIDDLADDDVLYIADQNHRVEDEHGFPRTGYLRAISLGHPLQPLNPVPLPDVDLTGHWPFGNGFQGIDVAGQRDRLYVASGQQSFDDGYVAEVDTTDAQVEQVVTLLYGDESFVHVDWWNPRRVFVATFDGFYNDADQGLYLHYLYGGQVLGSLRLMEDYDEYDGLRSMAFDPWHGRLYLAVGGSVMVVQVSEGESSPVSVSTEISAEGGSLRLPGGRAELEFPPGTVPQTVTVTYSDTLPSPAGELSVVRTFDLSAVELGTTTPVTSFNGAYTATFTYSDEELRPAIEGTLGLYWWNGSDWVREPSSQVDGPGNRLRAWPDHMTRFAILGETRRVFLPLVMRDAQ